MKVAMYSYQSDGIVEHKNNDLIQPDICELVLGFGDREELENKELYQSIRQKFPNATILLNSTAGEIFDTEVLNNSVSLVAINFEKTPIKCASVNIKDFENSFDAGIAMVNKLDQDNLRYILVISDGGLVNGSELVRGIETVVQHKIPVTGGLAGDGTRFSSTLVGLNDQPENGIIAALGFYGDHIKIGHGSMGGWEMFGPERKVTRSSSNQLFDIEGKNALELYKAYLGKYADELPGSALLFPLSVKLKEASEPVVRTILNIDEEAKSMTFAGDIPEGSEVRFMKANFDRLIDAASGAAGKTITETLNKNPKLALLVSCVGRKIILNNRVSEEVEAVAETLGSQTLLAGFYSYGEISPFNPKSKCELHNQTMTITTFDED